MEIAKGIEMLQLEFQEFVIHPILLWDDEMAVLIDTGFPGQIEDIQVEMEKVGVSFDKLKVVILTHQDIDHIGSLPELLQRCRSNIKVYAHELDKPYIEGDLPLLKDGNVENRPKGKVSDTMIDGQELPYCGGILILHTPGHTPGHISLYLKQSKILVAGDSMYSVNGMLGGIHAPTTINIKEAQQSLKKYLNLDIESVVCYHGGLSKGNIKIQLQNL
ncbi:MULTISPECIES: MBL fold metallo-hydrolase [Bacillus]|jgi:glyoxylase-like metal-dependent hydrolase (beta-lactamase superfamily II)|uniref:MBL fold metallo-hydrolase n=2 Tax=Bacillus cereus group TaxID=86661 RepID=A0A9X8X809_BACCE|nr:MULTISPECIES: MBL fold metallo-hydrolase [Bacillus]MBJ6720735.1 MBL fold metallo-hydrolase [Bacillus sp. PR5]MBR2787271.1 MBL fold metallo-hydrolase [Clostridia bacterium]TKV45819.1 MBL fold metallo-hydrolase [Bacillus sp. PIC28]HCX50826.1 MBL fold metallo-hydrolase [Bacillus sp. (in: firmicutes)]ALZ61951.1 putative metallo-hydrolase YflN [Bacillus cereus]